MYSWKGSPLYHGTKIIALCENHRGSFFHGIEVFCRTTDTVYENLVEPTLIEGTGSSGGEGKRERESSSSKKQVF